MRPYLYLPPEGETAANRPSHRDRTGWTRLAARAVAVLVAGSGALNLVSLMGGVVPVHEPEWLRRLFPLDFAGVSRTLTLLAGFALVLAALHLWTGKRRAWQLSLSLASASVLFHLTRGWDLGEAVCSAAIAALLWFARRHFRLGSDRPRLGTAAARAFLAFLVAGAYGAVGFWFLEPNDFHYNFNWWDASVQTLRLMLFWGDPGLAPHTAYAAWFLDSLFWIAAAAFFYSAMVLFRPVAYRFHFNRSESSRAESIATQYGRSGQDYFKHWPDKTCFFSSTRRSFLGYRVSGSYAIVLGDPVGPDDDRKLTIEEFVAYCRRRGWRVGFHQVGPESLRIYEALGFRRFKVGGDAIVDLTKFSLSGSARKEFRNTVNRLDRLGYRVERIDPPLTDLLLAQLRSISDGWLEIPGHRERRFTLGRFEVDYVRSTPVYVVFDPAGLAVAFLNLVPSYDARLATVDLMRRRRSGVNGLMDFLFAKVFLDLAARGFETFSLGMAPLSVQDDPNPIGADERIVHWVIRKMPFLFRADSLRRFKAKYADVWSPRYAVYQSPLDLPRFGLALRRITEMAGDWKEAA
ncbi:MAG: phosphatidylglycerol lysyltransferase domain-containing protein [Bryobacteraceae bacterium]